MSSGKPGAGIQGLQRELEDIPATGRADVIGDLLLAGLALRVEHYEIASYESLIAVAGALGDDSVVTLLQENLKDEQKMVTDGKALARRLAPQAAKDAMTEVALSAAD